MTADRPLVVLVRPWRAARGGGGCCSAAPDDVLGREPGRHDHLSHRRAGPGPEATVGEAYRLLRAALPEVDVQVVDAGNTVYLLPTTFRRMRRRFGVRSAVAAALRAPTAGALLVDGERVGDVADLGPEGVLAAVRERLPGEAHRARAHRPAAG
ncbi:hypothetical protein [Georgenia sp. AZ-5]|uniref:hypothetical protein n=1 Tax=Georgenia sp. AZ-5 TaxID=3367526 RepID=UPI003755384E